MASEPLLYGPGAPFPPDTGFSRQRKSVLNVSRYFSSIEHIGTRCLSVTGHKRKITNSLSGNCRIDKLQISTKVLTKHHELSPLVYGDAGKGSRMTFPATLESLSGSGILAALSREEQQHLLPSLQCVRFGLGATVYESGGTLDSMYFPTSCIISLVCTLETGMTAEVGLVGNEGAVGLALCMGGETMPNRAVVQLAGNAIRLRARALQEEFKRGGTLQLRLLLYTQALMTQISQTAVCNRLHSVEQRLCRWLLLCQDRANSNELLMTQEFIAGMLGGRRQSVTLAASRLQSAGLIRYSRGHIQQSWTGRDLKRPHANVPVSLKLSLTACSRRREGRLQRADIE